MSKLCGQCPSFCCAEAHTNLLPDTPRSLSQFAGWPRVSRGCLPPVARTSRFSWHGHRWPSQLLPGAGRMSLLLLFLWPTMAPNQTVMSVGLRSRPLPQRGTTEPMPTSSDYTHREVQGIDINCTVYHPGLLWGQVMSQSFSLFKGYKESA